MALEFKSPSEVADEYLTHLKSLKPEVNTKQTDSDWYVRSRVTGGVLSGLYADQEKVANDAFPQSARREAILRHLDLYFGAGFNPATVSRGPVKYTGTPGSFAAAGNIEFLYEPNGNVYVNTDDITIGAAGSGTVEAVSVSLGQAQNLLAGSELSISSPPAGFDSTAVVYGAPLSDGSDEETIEEASARILSRLRNPISGGKESDYAQWAVDADPSVSSASVIRYIYGLGTVGVVIAAGTSDIDAAVDSGDAVVLTPSDTLVDVVQAYIDSLKPLTDCAHVMGVVELPVDVTIKVKYSDGTGSTIRSGQTLTQSQLVQREVKRALYKTPAGGRRIGASGYVVASEIEEVIDLGLSSSPHVIGVIEMLVDRQVSDLAATGTNLLILPNQAPVPGTITVVEL